MKRACCVHHFPPIAAWKNKQLDFRDVYKITASVGVFEKAKLLENAKRRVKNIQLLAPEICAATRKETHQFSVNK